MPDEIRPPPFPRQPYPTAREEPTEPGIGINPEVMTLRRENMRLRRERNAAKEDLARSLTSSAPGTGSIPPDLTRKQKAAKFGLSAATVTLITAAAGVVVPIIAKKWPAYADLITGVLQNLGWQ